MLLSSSLPAIVVFVFASIWWIGSLSFLYPYPCPFRYYQLGSTLAREEFANFRVSLCATFLSGLTTTCALLQ